MESTKHRLPAALAVAAAVALPVGAAHAATKPAVKPATIRGVVVAREQGRGTLVVASSRGAVETLRTGAATRVGTRVAAKATRLADGTYRASSVHGSGVARHARVHGVVVSTARGRILLSAGGSVFGVDRSRVVSAVGGGTLQPGDVVDASVSIDPASGSVQEQSLQQVGQTSLVQLEGTIQSLAAGQLVLAVEHGALTTVSIPSSLTLPSAIAVGDSVELLAQFANGTFTLVTIQDDHAAALAAGGGTTTSTSSTPSSGSAGAEDSQAEIEAEGVVTAVSASSLSVQGEQASPVTFVVPSGFDVSAVKVGDRVHAKGTLAADGTITLVKLELQNEGQGQGEQQSGEVKAEGSVTALASGSLTVQPKEGGAPVAFTVPSGFDLSGVAVGDTVEAKGTQNADGTVTLVKLEVKKPESGGGQQSAEVEAEGSVTAVSSTSLTVQPGNGGTSVTFAVPAGFDVSAVKVGDQVDAKGTKNADGSVTLVHLEDKTSGTTGSTAAGTTGGSSGGTSGGSSGGDSGGSDSGNG